MPWYNVSYAIRRETAVFADGLEEARERAWANAHALGYDVTTLDVEPADDSLS